MRTYLVTGGAGFIGANFVKYLLKTYTDIRVVVLDALTYAGNLATIEDDLLDKRCIFVKGDICDSVLTGKLFNTYNFRYIVNFAAESHVDRSIENPQLFLITNILGTQNLMDIARRFWVTGKDEKGYPTWQEGVRFHQVSTDEVYGSLGRTGYFTETTPLDPHSPYSASKASADLFVKACHDTYKMPVTISRCSNNYGPCQFPEKLIPLIIKNVLEGKTIPVYGDGSNVRDWIHVEDHCRAIDLIIHQGRIGEVYNIGGNSERKNIHIVEMIIKMIYEMIMINPDYRLLPKKQVTDLNGQLSFDWINTKLIAFVTDRLGHDQRYAVDSGKIKNELGWTPNKNFESGLCDTIRWYFDNQSWVEQIVTGDYVNYYERMYTGR